MIGILLGWAIGAAGMKAATAARDKVLLKSSLQQAQESYVHSCSVATQSHLVTRSVAGSANPDQVFKLEIFQGEFLDIRYVLTRTSGIGTHLSQVISRLRRLFRTRHISLCHHPRVLQVPYFHEYLWNHCNGYILCTSPSYPSVIL